MSEFSDYLDRMMDSADKHHEEMRREFGKLLAEPCMTPPKVGDRVVVAVGLLNMGHSWIREECTVREVGESSVRVYWPGRGYGGTYGFWCHPALLTDNLGPSADAPESEG